MADDAALQLLKDPKALHERFGTGTIANLDFSGEEINFDFSGRTLNNVNLSNCELRGSRFSNSAKL